MRARVLLALALGCVVALGASAQEQDEAAPPDGGSSQADLAKAAQNPLSTMISLPFQDNINFGVERYEVNDLGKILGLRNRFDPGTGGFRPLLRRGLARFLFEEHDRTQNVLNIQPVYPFRIGNWNMVNRTIIPVIYQPIGKDDSEFGLGDINHTTWFSPAEPGKIIWGIGPTITIPTATDNALGADKWSAGPSFVVLTMPGKWVIGALASNSWSFAGESDAPDVNLFFSQVFVNYNLSNGWYLTSAPVITANWEADSDNRWTVPVGGGFGRIFKVGKQPLNAQIQGFYNVEKPDGAADWTLRLQLQFMFPKGRKG